MEVKILPGGRTAELLKEIKVETSEGKIIVPKGFQTDFASSPQLLWSIVPPWGKYSKAAIVHDYFYRTPSLGDGRLTRKEADDVFLEIMEDLGVPYWKRYSMYWAVRLFGGSSWID